MSSRSLGTLSLDLIAKTGGFESGMDKAARIADRKTREIERQAQARAKAIETAFGGIAAKIGGVFAGLQVMQFANQTIELQGRLDDLSKSTGLSVISLAGLDHAARQSGSNLDSVASAVNKLAVNMGKDAEKFAALGVTAKDPVEALGQLADILNGIEDPQKRAAVAAEALGKSWQELAPLLSEGSGGIRTLVEEGINLSGVTEENNKQAAAFGDNLEKLKTGAFGLANTIANPLLPALNDLIAGFTEAVKAKNLFGWAITSGDDEDNAAAKYDEISVKLQKLREDRDALSKPTFTNKLNDIIFGDVRDLDMQIAALEKQQSYLKSIVELRKKADEPAAPAPTTKTNPQVINSFLSNNQQTAKTISEGQRLIDQLRNRVTAAMQLTEVEKIELALVDKKYATMTPGERGIAVSLAQQIDLRNSITKQLDDELASVQKITQEYEAQDARLRSLVDATPRGQETQRLQDEALAESAFRSGQIDTTTYDQIIEKLHGVKEEGESTFLDLTTVANDAARSMADGFVDCLFDPMENSIQDMLLSFLKATAKMIAQAAMLNLVKAGMSAIGIGGPAEGTGGLFAKGGAFDGGVQAFASGGVVNRPTPFKFASGGSFKSGVMGEAGPEAILPLKRGSDGKLGVTMNGGGSGDTVVNVTVNHTGDNKKESTEGSDTAFREFGNRIKGAVLEVISNEKRPGGLLYA